MLFAEIPGLEEEKKQLICAVNDNHVAHAQLFVGKEGSANLALALAYSTYLNCENRQPEDSCGVCPSCVKNKKFIHPDVNFIFPTTSTPNIKSDDATSEKFLNEWRTFLTESPFGNVSDWAAQFGSEDKQLIIRTQESKNIIKALSLKAFEGKFKIMLVWLPEAMHANAANGILKILEEPPKDTIFLLVSNNANMLLKTITSRTQPFTVPLFQDEDIIEVIESKGIETERAAHIAFLAEGNMRSAIELSSSEDNALSDFFKGWMRNCFTYNFAELTKMAEDFQKGGKNFQKNLLLTGTKTMRETLIHGVQLTELNRLPDSEKGFIDKFSGVFSSDKISRLIPEIDSAFYHLERNANPKIIFLDLSIQIAQIARPN